jgi:hypothetical protein
MASENYRIKELILIIFLSFRGEKDLLSFGKKKVRQRKPAYFGIYHLSDVIAYYHLLACPLRPRSLPGMQAQVLLLTFMPLIKRLRALPGKTKKTCHTNPND